MRILKLALISIVAFYLLLWAFSMLFPNVTVLSRVRNLPGSSAELRQDLASNRLSIRQWLTADSPGLQVRTADIAFYRNDLFNAEAQPNADTVFFEVSKSGIPVLQGGVGLYQLQPDSVTTQLFYVFRTSWYKPWEKFALLAAEPRYGPQMDAALNRLALAVNSR